MKKTPNIDDMPKISGRKHVGPQTFKITQIIQFRFL